jgi:hypothetical protein
MTMGQMADPQHISVPAGIRAPRSLTLTFVRRQGETWDTSTALTGYLVVGENVGAPKTWECEVVSHSQDQVELKHTFDGAGWETDSPGQSLLAKFVLRLSGGTERDGDPFYLDLE